MLASMSDETLLRLIIAGASLVLILFIILSWHYKTKNTQTNPVQNHSTNISSVFFSLQLQEQTRKFSPQTTHRHNNNTCFNKQTSHAW